MSRLRSSVGALSGKFEAWHEAARRGSLSEATLRTYSNDVARFCASLDGRSLRSIDAAFVAKFIASLKPSLRRRMLSALSDFWAFALARKWVAEDVVRPLKFNRSQYASERQLSFFDLLVRGGLDESSVKTLRWAAFVEPLLARERSKLLVEGEIVQISPYAWNRLDLEFRALAASNDLRTLLARRVTCNARSRRVA